MELIFSSSLSSWFDQPQPFTPRHKIHLFHKSFPSVFLVPFGLPSWILDLERTKWSPVTWRQCPLSGHWRVVCFRFFFYIFILVTYVCYTLSWTHSAFQSTLKSRIVSIVLHLTANIQATCDEGTESRTVSYGSRPCMSNLRSNDMVT